MMATVMKRFSVDAFESLGVKARVQSALPMQQITETYARPKTIVLEKQTMIAAGTGQSVLYHRYRRRFAWHRNEL